MVAPDGGTRPIPSLPRVSADPSVRATDRHGASPGGFASGVRAGVGPALASLVLAIAFGAAARSYGWGVAAPIAASALVFSGSAQFAMATALTGGGGALGGIVAGALVTTRFIPMGVGLAPSLVGGRLRRAAESQAIVDPSWLAAHVGGGRFDRRLLLGASSLQWPCWVIGTVIGVLAAPPEDLFRALGLDVVFPAFFLILLLDELRRSRRARITAGIATAIAGSLVLVAPVGLALIGSGAAAGLGLLPGGEQEGEVVDPDADGGGRGGGGRPHDGDGGRRRDEDDAGGRVGGPGTRIADERDGAVDSGRAARPAAEDPRC